MINKPDIVIEKIRNKKDKHYVMKKFPAGWTDEQLDTWEIVKLNSPRVNINGKIYFYSLLYDMEYLYKDNILNIEFIRELFYYYNQSITELIKAFHYTYLDFEKDSDKILDSKGGISFDGFSFTLDSLSKSINNIGTYAPIYAYVNKQKGVYLVCGGRHRVVAINKLIQNGLWNNKKVLCVFWDSYNDYFECKIGMPNILIETLLYKLNHLVKEPIDENFSYITIKNITDLWIVYRIIEREIDFIIEKYENELILNNILPSKIINPSNNTIFNDRQLNYLKIKKSKYHSPDGKQLKNSLLDYNILTDIEYMKNIYQNFVYILKQIQDYNIFETGYLYKDFFLDFKSDTNDSINFDDFFTSYNTLRDIIYQKGCYLPLITTNKDNNMIAMECVHSKYPTKVLLDLYKNGDIDNRGIFYIKKELNDNNNIVLEIKVPKKLYDNVIYALDIPIKYISEGLYENWVYLDIYNKIDLWLIFKVLHKEVSYITGRYARELYENGIYPDKFINLGVT